MKKAKATTKQLKNFGEREKTYDAILNFGLRTQDVRRATILEAVIEILASDGVDQLTFESIGKKAKMARSHVVYYFPSRDALLDAAMRFVALSAQEIIIGKLQGLTDWRDLLRHYVEANFDWISEHRSHAAVFLLMYYQAAIRKPVRKLHSDAREAGARRIAGILQLRPTAWKEDDLARATQGVQAIITGNLIDAVTTIGAKDFSDRRQETLLLVDRLVESYRR